MNGFMQMVRDVATLHQSSEGEWIADPAHVDEWVAALARLSDHTIEEVMNADRDQLQEFVNEVEVNVELRILLAMSQMTKGPVEPGQA